MANHTNISIDLRKKTPIFDQLYASMRSHILTHSKQQALHSPMQLANALKIDVSIVNLVYQQLLNELIIEERDGHYYSKSEKIKAEFPQHTFAIKEIVEKLGFEFKTFDTVSIVLNLEKLEVFDPNYPKTKQHYLLSRLIYAGNIPFAYMEAYLIKDKFLDFDKLDIQHKAYYQVLNQHYGLVVSKSRRYIRGLYVDTKISNILKLALNTPIMVASLIGHDQHDEIVDYINVYTTIEFLHFTSNLTTQT